MAKFTGQQGFVQYSIDGGSTWKHLMSLTKKTFKNDAKTIDMTTDESGLFTEAIQGMMTPTLSCEGLSEKAAASSGHGSFKELVNLQVSNTSFSIRVVDNESAPSAFSYAGVVSVKSVEQSFETDKAVGFKADFLYANSVTII